MKLIKELDKRFRKCGIRWDYWGLFICDYCNKEVEKEYYSGLKAKSCGCARLGIFTSETLKGNKYGFVHGFKHDPIYSIWYRMVARCHSHDCVRYKDWGGRGIQVCKEWRNKEDFPKFRDYFNLILKEENLTIEEFKKQKRSIDRINNDGNYEYGNLRTATQCEQNHNKRKYKRKIGSYEEADEVRRMKSDGVRPKDIIKHFELLGIGSRFVKNVLYYNDWIK